MGATADGVLIEWVATGTLPGGPIKLRGADRYTLRDGKVTEGVAYFDPRPVLDRQRPPASRTGAAGRTGRCHQTVGLWAVSPG
jgi:hypothetical protein